MPFGYKKGCTTPNRHKPTPQRRAIVAALAGCGIAASVICKCHAIACGEPVLRKYYSEELKYGREIANKEVIATAYKLAVSGKVPAMTMFWLKTRCGWRETNHQEPTEDTAKLIIDILRLAGPNR